MKHLQKVVPVFKKHIDLKSMDLEEAKWSCWDMISSLYGCVDDNTTNVIYRREDGDLGFT